MGGGGGGEEGYQIQYECGGTKHLGSSAGAAGVITAVDAMKEQLEYIDSSSLLMCDVVRPKNIFVSVGAVVCARHV